MSLRKNLNDILKTKNRAIWTLIQLAILLLITVLVAINPKEAQGIAPVFFIFILGFTVIPVLIVLVKNPKDILANLVFQILLVFPFFVFAINNVNTNPAGLTNIIAGVLIALETLFLLWRSVKAIRSGSLSNLHKSETAVEYGRKYALQRISILKNSISELNKDNIDEKVKELLRTDLPRLKELFELSEMEGISNKDLLEFTFELTESFREELKETLKNYLISDLLEGEARAPEEEANVEDAIDNLLKQFEDMEKASVGKI